MDDSPALQVKCWSVIHATPEAYDGGLLAKVRDGDIIRVNGQTGECTLLVDEAELAAREPHIPRPERVTRGDRT
ncbi:dihydroxy-acid dehydratase [Shigella flexneri]